MYHYLDLRLTILDVNVICPVQKAEVGDFALANSSSVLGQDKKHYFLGGEQLSFHEPQPDPVQGEIFRCLLYICARELGRNVLV